LNNPQFTPDVAGAGKQQITGLKDLGVNSGGNLSKTLGGLFKKKP
jgi:hypothetical protein